MLNISSMTGILNAQYNIKLAERNQADSRNTVDMGRIRESQGIRDGNSASVQQGLEMQAQGEAIQLKTFEHIGKAVKDLDSVVIEKPDNDKTEANNSDTDQSAGNKINESGKNDDEDGSVINIKIGDDIQGSTNVVIHSAKQSSVDLSV